MGQQSQNCVSHTRKMKKQKGIHNLMHRGQQQSQVSAVAEDKFDANQFAAWLAAKGGCEKCNHEKHRKENSSTTICMMISAPKVQLAR